jgi:hypothetical protein
MLCIAPHTAHIIQMANGNFVAVQAILQGKSSTL